MLAVEKPRVDVADKALTFGFSRAGLVFRCCNMTCLVLATAEHDFQVSVSCHDMGRESTAENLRRKPGGDGSHGTPGLRWALSVLFEPSPFPWYFSAGVADDASSALTVYLRKGVR